MIQKTAPVLALYFAATLLLAAPFQASAITTNQISALVQVVCPGQNGTWFSGSGTIIDSKGIILTNKHVVTDQSGNIIQNCAIGLTKSISQPPSFDYTAAVKYYTTDPALDAAILYIDNKNNISFPAINAFSYDTNNLKLGDGIEVIGYPTIGGNTITYVNGVMSGVSNNYIKTTAPLEHGNSGGSAYTLGGDFIGIPSAVVSGELNSISFILDIDRIKAWLQSVLGSSYLNTIESQNQPRISAPLVLSADVTPPDASAATALVYADSEKNMPLNFEKSYDIDWPYFTWEGFKDDSGIAGYYVYFGKDINAVPVNAGVFTQKNNSTSLSQIKDPGVYYLKVQAKDNKGNISNSAYWTYYYKTSENIGTVDYGQSPSGKALANRPTKFYVYSYNAGVKGDLLKVIYLDSKSIQRFTVPTNNIYIEWDSTKNTGFITDEVVTLKKANSYKVGDWAYNCDQQYYYTSTQDWISCMNDGSKKQLSASGEDYMAQTNMQINTVYEFNFTSFFNNNGKKDQAYNGAVFEITPTKSVSLKQVDNAGSLKGRILLQVESHGEAWYVNPNDGKRYYMKDGSTAYQMMRQFGLGITNTDLAKLPQEGEAKSYPTALSNLKGKILLQVQSHGEAWYVHPQTGIRYYLKDGEAAYNLMRHYSLGITNKNLEAIPEGKF